MRQMRHDILVFSMSHVAAPGVPLVRREDDDGRQAQAKKRRSMPGATAWRVGE